MPPKRTPASKGGKTAPSKTKNGPRGMGKPIDPGLVMTDLLKKQWKLGPVIGQGGFGYIYLGDTASVGNITTENANNVIKVEPHKNGPLFVELAFYQRVAKAETVNEWSKKHKKKHVGIPVYLGQGSFDHGEEKYRFMIMDRFGKDVEKLYKECDFRFPETTVYSLGLRVLDALEYIHDNEYVHADIKSSNIMMGYKKANQAKMYLLDYGLAYRYCPAGKHVPYKEDPKRKHDGTIEYTSRDAHLGLAPSRRGDMEILAYCMVQWLCKKLPWENKLTDKDYVASKKNEYMKNIPRFMEECFGNDAPAPLEKYLHIVVNLGYDERPDYEQIRKLFSDGLKKAGAHDDGVSVVLSSKKRVRSSMPSTEDEDEVLPSPKKSRARAASKNSPKKAPSQGSRAKLSKKRTISPKKVVEEDENDIPLSPKKSRTARAGSKISLTKKTMPSTSKMSVVRKSPVKSKVQIIRCAGSNSSEVIGRVVHRRSRRKNVPTRDFGQSP